MCQAIQSMAPAIHMGGKRWTTKLIDIISLNYTQYPEKNQNGKDAIQIVHPCKNHTTFYKLPYFFIKEFLRSRHSSEGSSREGAQGGK